MEQLENEENQERVKSKTEKIPLEGGPFIDSSAVRTYRKNVIEKLVQYGYDPYFGWYLVSTYGRQADQVINIFEENYLKETDKEKSMLLAELDFCIQNEMVVCALDFIVRRTGRLFFDIQSVRIYSPDIIRHMSKACNWTMQRGKNELEKVEKAVFEASEIFRIG